MRLGVLDVGSNTVHLQVMDAVTGARPIPNLNFKQDVRLTEFLTSDGAISVEGIRVLREAIRRSLAEAKKAKTEEVFPFATSALREARNGPEIIEEINHDFEIDLQVLSGEDEARMTFLAARRWYGWSSGRLFMIDIGGGSLELAVGINEVPDIAVSLPLGASRLTRSFLEGDPFTKKSLRNLQDFVDTQIEDIAKNLIDHDESDRCIGTSKTIRTLARLCGDWLGGDGKSLRVDWLRKITPKLAEMSDKQRAELPGVSASRARQITAGALVAESVMRQLNVDELEICPWALREGVVLRWFDWIKS
jgi:exopolyphosphatase / guanosine-5'-triphosphate,3'-diphosphate pyrophosphatase